MRLGVLDVGSNTVHLLVVDAHRGAHPTPMNSQKTALRLGDRIGSGHYLSADDTDELVRIVDDARKSAARLGCEELIAFATSAIREATNATEVLDVVRTKTGVSLEVLPGEEESRLTFLAARRWFGWSAGKLLLLDIGGGSLEMAIGVDEDPDLAVSLPLGAGRVTRAMLSTDPPEQDEVAAVRSRLRDELAGTAKSLRKHGKPDRVVATSKTFRSLARLAGAAPASSGPLVPRTLSYNGLRQLLGFITRITARDLATLDGVSAARSHQLVGGALVAEATMRALSLSELSICPWALREGVILRRLDHTNGDDHTPLREITPESEVTDTAQPDRRTGRKTQHRARWSG